MAMDGMISRGARREILEKGQRTIPNSRRRDILIAIIIVEVVSLAIAFYLLSKYQQHIF